MAKIRTIVTIIVRLVALAATIVAIVSMVTSSDSAHVLNLTFTAKYGDTPAFKFFVVAEAIAGGYTLIILLLTPKKGLFWRLFIILDSVTTLLLTSSISAALAIGLVGKNGSSHAGWLPVCGQVPKFCDHATASLVAGFVAAIAYFLLFLYSLHATLSPIFGVKP